MLGHLGATIYTCQNKSYYNMSCAPLLSRITLLQAEEINRIDWPSISRYCATKGPAVLAEFRTKPRLHYYFILYSGVTRK